MKTHARLFSTLMCLALMAVPPLGFAAGYASQFLDVHPELKPDPNRAGAKVWEKPGFNRSKYTKVMFEPLSLFLAPDSEYKGFNAEDVNALGSGFRDVVVQTLEPELPVVQAAGPDVLYVRVALTNVKLKKEKRGLLSFTPIGLVVTAVKDAAGKRISVENAVIEMEARDSVTGEPLAVVVDARPGGKEELSWNSIEETFKFYATRFKSRMLAKPQK